MNDEFLQWLREQLDDDERAARAVLGVSVLAAVSRGKPAPRWVPSPEGDAGIWDTDGTPRVKHVWARERDHIIRHDPARVLAEVDAKRQMLAIHRAVPNPDWDRPGVDGRSCTCCITQYPCPTLRLLALPYADRPGYRDEWRP